MMVNRAAPMRQQRSRTKSVPAPVGGWNQRDSLAAMPPQDAAILDNWFPTPYDVGVRKGCVQTATGFTGNVETLATYNAGSFSKMFGVVGGSIFDMSVSGPVGPAQVTGLSNSRFQKANIGTPGGQFMVMVNGADPMLVYNGTGWQRVGDGTGQTITAGSAIGFGVTITTAAPHGLSTGNSVTIAGATPSAYNGTYSITVIGPSQFTYTAGSAPAGPMTVVGTYTYAPAVSGVSTSLWSNVCMHMQRLWFIEKNSLRGWYLPTQSIGGAASLFDFSAIFRKGGYLVSMATWTIDAGYGLDDMLVIITSRGECAVYKGTDPNTISTWSLVGVYELGSPIGPRSTQKFAGDCLIINRDGIIPLSAALQSSRIEVSEAISDKILWAISSATTTYGNLPGWEIAMFPTENMLVVNVPTSSKTAMQFVMNTVSKAWCRFTGWNSFCFEMLNDELYFGGANKVYKAWVGTNDNGANIRSEALQAFNYFDAPAQLKMFNMVRPMFAWDNRPLLRIGINTDFDESAPKGLLTASQIRQTLWDDANARWDAPNTVWMGPPSYQKGWQTCFGVGYCAAFHVQCTTNTQQLRWASTDYLYQPGGVL